MDIGGKEGAKLVVDGRNIKLQGFENGFFIGGCLFDHVEKNMKIYKEEIFGPVLSVVRVKDFKSALNLVNDHEFGNGTSIYTRDGDVGRTFASKLKSEWLELIFLFLYLWHFIALVAGNDPCLEINICTVLRE